MTKNYNLVRLGDLCDSISGLWTGKKPPFEKATVIRNTNFTKDCKLDLSNVAVLDVETKQLQSRRLMPGDLIVEKSGGGPNQAVGRVVHFNESVGTYSLSNFTSALRIKNSSEAIPKYLQHFLYYQYISGVTETMQSNSTGIRNLNIHQFLDIEIPLPSIEKQLEIVEKLDSAFADIYFLERNVKLGNEKIDQLFESLISSAFTPNRSGIKQNHSQLNDSNSWHEVSLKELCKVDWGNTKLTKSSYVANGTFLAVSASGADGRIDYYEHESNVPVLSAIGAQCGKMFYPNEKFTAIKNTITLTPKTGMADGKFLYYLFSHVELPQRGAGQPFISKGDIEAFRVEVPINLKEQQEIVQKLDDLLVKIELLKSQYKKEIDQASALRQSLLNSAFTLEEEVA